MQPFSLRAPSQIWGQEGNEGPPGLSFFCFSSKARAQVLPKHTLDTQRLLPGGSGMAPEASQHAFCVKIKILAFDKNNLFLQLFGHCGAQGPCLGQFKLPPGG